MTKKTQFQIEKITKQIVQKYQPLRIILFGSTASGKEKKDSDLDLLIIKNTDLDPIRRVQELSSLIDRDIPCDFLVYTPGELKQRSRLGDYLITEILQKGKTVYEKQ